MWYYVGTSSRPALGWRIGLSSRSLINGVNFENTWSALVTRTDGTEMWTKDIANRAKSNRGLRLYVLLPDCCCQ